MGRCAGPSVFCLERGDEFTLLLRFTSSPGARRMGAINLRLKDLDHTRQTIWLREKFATERE